ncbi:aspartate aminotransferase family protein [Natrinema salaciae]|uniref:Ornithine aminotransferase n=1 Tax=Natrinema salaciae TaxID=1186196 RepID=A0A1H9RJ25_9EURY|nr:aspartate aminotransferase family protein [Natrinema salaciae]SER72545.1 4-aminobutyrate aminotransferase / (S)-3-amino-2-methylpropionate transaminase [Natrinema salaciae]
MARQTDAIATNEQLTGQYDEYLMPIWKDLHVPVERASGCTLEDFEGNEYLDLFSGIAVTNVGHGDDAVVEAAKAQLDEFVHGCTYVHPHEPAAELAERLAEITPGDLQKSFFCNSGTEAVEGAIKLARKYTGSKEVVALEMGFHGRTLGSLALTGNNAYKADMAPTINDVAHTPAPYRYRSPSREADDETFVERTGADLERVIGTHTADDLAAIVVEPVMGEGGIIVPPTGYLRRLKEIAREHGALLIVDEVQSGYGRTGKLFASDHYDAVPDILTQAKGIANGLPLGAFTAPAEIANAFESGDHLSTFGGNPVACAAALATIDRLEEAVLANAREQGAWLGDELATLEDEYDVVGDARGLGLMRGLEFVDPDAGTGPAGVAPEPDAEFAKHVGKRLRERGIVAGVGGYYKNVLRVQPPLSIDREQLERGVAGIRESIDAELEDDR